MDCHKSQKGRLVENLYNEDLDGYSNLICYLSQLNNCLVNKPYSGKQIWSTPFVLPH